MKHRLTPKRIAFSLWLLVYVLITFRMAMIEVDWLDCFQNRPSAALRINASLPAWLIAAIREMITSKDSLIALGLGLPVIITLKATKSSVGYWIALLIILPVVIFVIEGHHDCDRKGSGLLLEYFWLLVVFGPYAAGFSVGALLKYYIPRIQRNNRQN